MRDLRQIVTPEAIGGFWPRFVAHVIDMAILIVPQYALTWISVRAYGKPAGLLVGFLVEGAFSFFYFGLLQAQLRGTFGKKALGLALVSTDGATLGLKQASIRYLVLSATSILGGLGYFSVLFNRQRQGFHDLAARTIVVRREFLERLGETPAENAPVAPVIALGQESVESEIPPAEVVAEEDEWWKKSAA